MKVNACDTNSQALIKLGDEKTKASQDLSGVFLQLLLGGILNTSSDVPQTTNLLTGTNPQNDESGTANASGLSGVSNVLLSSLNKGNALSVLNQLGQADGGFTGAGFFNAQDSVNSIGSSKVEAAGAGDGKTPAVTAGQIQGNVQNLSQDLLNAIKSLSDMEGKSSDLNGIDSKGINIKDAQGGDKGTLVEKTVLGQQASGNKLAGAVLKPGSTTDAGSLLKSGIKGAAQNVEEMKLTSSGEHDKQGFSTKTGDGQETAKEDASASCDAKMVLKNDSQVFQDTAGLKQVSNQAGQTSVEKQSPVVNKDDILNQVYSKIKVLNGESSSELHVSLKPDQLGDVSIKLVMEKGVINARITVENSNVKNIMETNMAQIKEHLKEQNVNVSHLSVYVGTGQKEADSGRNFQQYKWQQTKRIQSEGDVPAVNIQGTQYYGGVLNLLA